MRPIWSGSLSFGLVNIPVRVYSAAEDHELDFHMLHKKDLSPVRYARVCKADGQEIPYNEIVKGYEYQKGEYVVVDEEDFKNANPKKTKTLEIQNFTHLVEIDPMYFERPYYLEPDKGASKGYALLREALKKGKKVAVVNFVFHNKEHIGAITTSGKALVLIQLRYHSNLRKADELNLPAQEKLSSKEVNTALDLVEKLTEKFQPEKYKDTYSDELHDAITAKLKGKKPAKKGKTPTKYTPAADLMQLLQESLKTSITKQKFTSEHLRSPSLKKGGSKKKKSK